MPAVQIAGCSAAGKSTVATVLAARGLRTLDADADPRLARMTDRAGSVVPDTPAAPGLDWLGRHDWTWDSGRLDEVLAAAGPGLLFVCGGADNQDAVANRFAQVFLLEIDEPTMLARLDARRDHHDWGQVGDTRAFLIRKRPHLQASLRAAGATVIDARHPPGQVAGAILARLRPGLRVPGPGQAATGAG